MDETGLPGFLDTGLALVGLELLVHIENIGTDPSFPVICDPTKILAPVEINVTETGGDDDYSTDIIDEIETRFGYTLHPISGVLNPHPSKIFFIIDNSGSYELSDFVTTYNSIKTHYTDAGMSSDEVDARFGASVCCGSTPMVLQGGMYCLVMSPLESWFRACVNQILNHVEGT